MSAAQSVRALGRLLLAGVPLWLIFSVATSSELTPAVRAAVVATCVLALVAPAEGLLVVALLTPLGELVGLSMMAPIRFAEAVVVAFFAGWLLRPALAPRIGPSPPAAIKYAAGGLAAIVLASIAVQALQLRSAAPAAWSNDLWILSRSYFDVIGDPIGAVSGARLLEGIALASAVIVLLRTRPILANRIPEALGIGGVLAVAASLLLREGIAFPAVLARHALLGSRYSAQVADVNAAGSYFALLLCMSAGMSGRETGSKRMGWAAASAIALVGLWMCGSKSASAAAAASIAIAAIWMLTRQWPRIARLGLIAIVMAAIAVAAVALDRQNDPKYQAAGFRTQFTETTYRLIRAHPWFGVGIGQYYPNSPLFLTPRLGFAYGGENAHDYFLQMAAEIGLMGFAACVVLVAGTGWLVARTLARAPDDYRLIGLAAGVAAFLLTSVTGHPLLVNEVAYPFWIAAGLLLVLASPIATDTRTPLKRARTAARRIVFAAAVVLLVVSTPLRARDAPFRVRHTREIEGLYGWEDGADGRRYRWTEPYASVLIEGYPGVVAIPMRAPAEEWGSAGAEVSVSIDGDRPRRWTIGSAWTSIRIEMPAVRFLQVTFRRINIRTEPARTLADPSGGSTRTVGVQLGEPVVR